MPGESSNLIIDQAASAKLITRSRETLSRRHDEPISSSSSVDPPFGIDDIYTNRELHIEQPSARYIVAERLGRGGFGLVYRCESKDTGDIYVCKEIEVLSDSRRASAEAEVEILRSLNHENKIRFHDESSIILHIWGIIHHDLKTQNIVLNDQGAVKLIDFGMALDTRNVTEYARPTGTLQFMAPEGLIQRCLCQDPEPRPMADVLAKHPSITPSLDMTALKRYAEFISSIRKSK